MSESVKCVQIATCDLSGVALRYAVAKARGIPFKLVEPTYGLCHRVLVEGMNEYYRPDVDWVQTGALLTTHWVPMTEWLISTLGPDWRDTIDRTKHSLQTWFCRAFVGVHTGDQVLTPKVLLTTVTVVSTEPVVCSGTLTYPQS